MSEDLEDLSYRELQEKAKEVGIKANQSTEELIEALKEEVKGKGGVDFGSMKQDIEDKIGGKEDIEVEIEGEVERVSTGDDGLDEILNGGIPKNNLVLVSGGPGTGKTTLGLQFLIEGIENGETGIYVNMDENEEDIIRNARLFGWDLEKHMENDDLHFVSPQLFKFDKAKKKIDSVASRFDAERIVIDSISVLESAVDEQYQMRKGIMELNQRFSRMDATALSISEVSSETDVSRHGVEEYATDGIIRIYYKRKKSVFHRGLTIRKMRGTSHSNNVHPIDIGKNGIKVYPDEKVFGDI